MANPRLGQRYVRPLLTFQSTALLESFMTILLYRFDLERGETTMGHGVTGVRPRHVERHRLRDELLVCGDSRLAHRFTFSGSFFL